ncbi:unnamed protein product [Malus baccata var. baccata]
MATSTYLFFTLIIASSLCSFGVSRVEPQKVTLSVYYETLCPYCATFIEKNLARIFDKGLITILNLRLVPWGNASTATFCQHGQDECYLNSIQACAISVWPNVKQHLPFISCVEYLAVKEHRLKEDVWKYCCQIHNMSHEPLLTCYSSGYERKDYQNFERYVCEAYEGYPKPQTCSRFIAPPGLLSWSSSAETTNFAIRSYILHLLLLRAALLLVN